MPRPDDYRLPRTGAWMPCVSDRGMYVRFSTSTSTVARVEAFERMHRDPTLGRTAGFFDPLRDPSPEEFTAARMIYLEAEGLDSRVSRRSDEHYPAPMVNDCRMDAVRMANPDYCVGPSRLLPVLTEAFRLGQTAAGTVPSRVHAARIEAALLWFLYLSPYKESLTCTTTTADCDSAWAYYTGGAPPDAPMQLGLARRVAALEPATHLRIFDGLLAVRCWRDLDGAATATDTALRDRARAQLDRALTRGMVAVVLARLEALAVATGPEALAQRAFLSTLAPLLERPVLAAGGGEVVRDGLRALAGEGALSPAQLRALARALDQSTPCP
jgi:hypothetical protein